MHDIVLYIRGGKNEELRYAVRTWCENLEFNSLLAVGGPKPDWFEPDIYIENPTKFQTMRQCFSNLTIALADERLTDDVIIMMDDIFLLDYCGEWDINHNRGTLQSQYERLVSAFGKSAYTDMVRNTARFLEKEFEAPLSFEEHAPFLCNRKKLLNLLESVGVHEMSNLLWRSIYGNRELKNGLRTEQRKDVKINNATAAIPSQASIVSTNEPAFNGNSGNAIKDWFPAPSPYEK